MLKLISDDHLLSAQIIMFKTIRVAFNFCRKLNTQVFDKLTNKEFATPELMKKILLKPIHMHSRVSQISLYHKKRVRHAVKSCFSEKKYDFLIE